MEVDALVLEFLKHRQGVGGRAEGAVELGGNDDVALADCRQEPLALGPVGERDRARHTALDEMLGERIALHQAIAHDLLLLNVEARATVSLLGGRNSRISEDAHDALCAFLLECSRRSRLLVSVLGMFMSRVSVLIPDFVLAKIMITVGLMMMMHGRVMTSRAS
jgi:hypothetical protein